MTFRTKSLLAVFGLIIFGALGVLRVNGAAGADRPGDSVDFAREVLPILSNKCFVCHGPDVKKKGFLRLDSFASATRDRGGYRAIDPGNPEKSELLARIHDRDDPMPPADAEKQLTAAERDVLSRWARQGGRYASHWAFVPPVKRPPPAGGPGDAGGNVIDAFIGTGLRAAGVSLAPVADRRTLARRVALVLTGLPPEPEQLAAFLADDSDDAYERFVNTMLASPGYGEHQARYWLDAVRYGDTHGLHLDNRRGIFPYRDWVVRALNTNLPLDDFITWQLAGDLLPDPTLEQHVATGFVRMNPTTSEGGVLPEEFQAKNNFDRVETIGTVLLGMTLTCARCHTHKYDPIPQEEYYRLFAFFNSTSERPLDGNSYTYGPVIRAPADQASWDEWSELERERRGLFEQAKVDEASTAQSLLSYAAERASFKTSDWRISKSSLALGATGADWEEAKGLPGARKDRLPGPGEARWVSFRAEVPTDGTLWLTFSGGPGSEVRVDGARVLVDPSVSRDGAELRVPLLLSKGAHSIQLALAGTKEGPTIEVRVENPWKSLASSKRWEACPVEDRLLMIADPLGPLRHRGRAERALGVARRLEQLESRFTTSLVARDLPSPRETHVLRRGEYNLPIGDPLEPGVLTVMGRFPEGAPANRLGLARWLTSREHPLVSRVLINRVWQRVFGEGIVRTPEDFGLQGQQPTHPRLLDWLAVELQESGWDLQHMLRLMLHSRTFRQRSTLRSDIDDPENRRFGRGPRHRLDAEVIRDLGLWSSRLLDPAMGGEGVKPYQPGGLWAALAHPASNTKKYVRDRGEKLYRRSLYVYWKRTSPHPMMTLFDAPSRESSCVRRSRTNTALQSLGLLNETQRIEISRKLAERLLREREGTAARLELLFTLLACRGPNEVEVGACTKLLDIMTRRYRGAEKDALALLSLGDAARDESLDPAELAAWTQVAVTVLASDVALMLY